MPVFCIVIFSVLFCFLPAVSPGGVAEVKGAHLNCDRTDGAQGVFFVDSSTGAGRKAEVVHKSSGSSVTFKVPPLAKGVYCLTVRRGFGSELREGRFKADVSVN